MEKVSTLISAVTQLELQMTKDVDILRHKMAANASSLSTTTEQSIMEPSTRPSAVLPARIVELRLKQSQRMDTFCEDDVVAGGVRYAQPQLVGPMDNQLTVDF